MHPPPGLQWAPYPCDRVQTCPAGEAARRVADVSGARRPRVAPAKGAPSGSELTLPARLAPAEPDRRLSSTQAPGPLPVPLDLPDEVVHLVVLPPVVMQP